MYAPIKVLPKTCRNTLNKDVLHDLVRSSWLNITRLTQVWLVLRAMRALSWTIYVVRYSRHLTARYPHPRWSICRPCVRQPRRSWRMHAHSSWDLIAFLWRSSLAFLRPEKRSVSCFIARSSAEFGTLFCSNNCGTWSRAIRLSIMTPLGVLCTLIINEFDNRILEVLVRLPLRRESASPNAD
jgi:hypothetical protein